ncbi:MAG: rhomboid family intramembrane serine protease [Bacteroidia bacterium]
MDNYYRPASYSLLPPVIKWMLIINTAMFLITLAAQQLGYEDVLINFLALHYFGSNLFFPHQLVTYAFMHGGWPHLLLNMFALWMFGTMVENTWGSKRFLIYYMFTAIGAGLTHWAFQYYEIAPLAHHVNAFIENPDPGDLRLLFDQNSANLSTESIDQTENLIASYKSEPKNPMYIKAATDFASQLLALKSNSPVLGASGAVFGVLLAFGMLFPNMLIYIYFLFPVKAKYVVAAYGLMEIYYAVQNNPGDNVAHLAHLGGMLFGIILILLWRRRGSSRWG